MMDKESEPAGNRLEYAILFVLANRSPAQAVLRQHSNIARIDAASPEAFDEGDPITAFIFGNQVRIGGDDCLEIVAERDIDRWTIVQSADAHRQNVLRAFGG